MKISIIPSDSASIKTITKLEQQEKYTDAFDLISVEEELGLELTILLIKTLVGKKEYQSALTYLGMFKELNIENNKLIKLIEVALSLLVYSHHIKTTSNKKDHIAFLDNIEKGFEFIKEYQVPEVPEYLEYIGYIYNARAISMAGISKPDDAIIYYNKARKCFKNTNRKEFTLALISIGNMYHMKGDLKSAKECYVKALEVAKIMENLKLTAGINNNLGVIYRLLGNLEKSLQYYQESLIITRKLDLTDQTAALLNNIGIIYYYKGELEDAIKYYKDSLKLRKELGISQQIASSYDNIGEAYQKLGQLDNALKYLNLGLEIRKSLKIGLNLAKSLENIGTIYRIKGEILKAIKYFKESLELKEELGNTIETSKTLLLLGKAYQIKGNYDKSLELIHQSLEYRSSIGNIVDISSNLFELFKLHLEMDKIDEAVKIKNQLEIMEKDIDNDLVRLRLELVEASLNKLSKRMTHKVKALDIFKKIGSAKLIDFESTLYALLNQFDLLVYELKISEDYDVLDELKKLTDNIMRIAIEQDVYSLLVEGLLLKSKLYIIDFKFQKGKEALVEALTTAERYDLRLLAARVYLEQNKLEDNYSSWSELFGRNASIAYRIETAQIEDYLAKMVTNRQLDRIIIHKENPVMILIINNIMGITLFSKNFTLENQLNDSLIGSFVSALNAFGRETFSIKSNIEKIKIGEYSIIIQPIENISILYVYTLESYNAVIRLNEIIELIRRNKETWKSLQEFKGNISISKLDKIDMELEKLFTSPS